MSNLLNKLPSRFTVNLTRSDDLYVYNYVYGGHLVKLFYNAEDGSIDVSIGGFSVAVDELEAKHWTNKELTLDLLQEKIRLLVSIIEEREATTDKVRAREAAKQEQMIWSYPAFPSAGGAEGMSYKEWLIGQFASSGATPKACVIYANEVLELLHQERSLD